MRFFNLTLFIILLTQLLNGQNARIQELENNVAAQNGQATIEQSLELSNLYFESEQYNLATRSAIKAFTEAQRVQDKESMSKALQMEAKVIMKVKLPRRMRKKAYAQLEKKMKLLEDSPNKELKKESLEMLKEMAVHEGMEKEAEVLDQKIKELDQDRATLPDQAKAETGDLPNQIGPIVKRVPKAREFLEEFKNKKVELDKQLEELNMENDALAEALKYKESAIAQMNEDQITQALLLSQQENILNKQRMKLDSLNTRQLQDSLQLVEIEMRSQKVEAVAERQRSQRNFFILVAFLVLVMAAALFSRYMSSQRTNKLLEDKNKEIAHEKQRAEALLLNILPVAVAEELKQKGKASTRFYSKATVLFTDFQNFSEISKNISPEELVNILDHCYKSFDQIIDKYRLEKIKTIGDAYMCAGGLPEPDPQHPKRVIEAALEIQDFLNTWNFQQQQSESPLFEARVGIHTGPVVAGVVGSKKFAYDIWGDTVNIASRMESNGATGKVNISGPTYQIIKDYFDCDHRGKIPTKNIGEVDMYFVNRKP